MMFRGSNPNALYFIICVWQMAALQGFVLRTSTSSSSSGRFLRLSQTTPTNGAGDEALTEAAASWTMNSTIAPIQFGDVVPARPRSQSSTTIQFGDVVPARRRPTSDSSTGNDYLVIPSTTSTTSSVAETIRRRNLVTAVLSVGLAITSWVWQFLHPISPVQLLYTMQQSSQPMTVIGVNQKPTVVDFWAPWCENCKLIAPTLLQIEEEYKDRVNFIMVDADQASSWDYVEAFNVDAIPHLALVSADGSVETALIGPIPKHVLEADLNVLLENARQQQQQPAQQPAAQQQPLPYKMLDTFAGNPNGRKVHFDQ